MGAPFFLEIRVIKSFSSLGLEGAHSVAGTHEVPAGSLNCAFAFNFDGFLKWEESFDAFNFLQRGITDVPQKQREKHEVPHLGIKKQ